MSHNSTFYKTQKLFCEKRSLPHIFSHSKMSLKKNDIYVTLKVTNYVVCENKFSFRFKIAVSQADQ